ncbi:MAG: 7-cyano-7-deazaguanine synthase QueC [Pseudomonadota bacterium]
MKKKAVVLLSGGMDSATSMAIARKEGFELYALSFTYGQRHAMEVEKAKKLAEHFGAKDHLILSLDLPKIGGSALISKEIPLPKGRSLEEIGKEIPATYVPARNTLFLAYALAWAEVIGAGDIVIGVNALDYSGYPDCRPAYIRAFEEMANLATKAGVEGRIHFRIHTPLINLRKAEIIKMGVALGVDYSLTHSCYDPLPDGRACGECDSCKLRLKGFKEAGFDDPISYR